MTEADLAAVDLPTLVISGTASHRVFANVARRIAGALPDSRLVAIEGGHVTYLATIYA